MEQHQAELSNVLKEGKSDVQESENPLVKSAWWRSCELYFLSRCVTRPGMKP